MRRAKATWSRPRLLLDAGADVNQATEYGWTPLLTATNNRHYKLGAYLLERGADVNIANKGGWTPLYLATDNRNIEGGDYPVPKPDMDHLRVHQAPARPRRRSERPRQGQHADADDLHDAVVLRSGRDAVHPRGAVERHGADEAAARLRRRSDHRDATTATRALTAAGGIGWVEGVTYERSPKENIEAVKMLLDLGLDPNAANSDGRTPLMAAAMKGRNEVVQMLVDKGAKLDTRDSGSRDTDTTVSVIAGHTWQALDYADGLVRVGVQSAVTRPETAALIRKLMTERGLPVPPPNRVVESICVVEMCEERTPKKK